MENEFNKSALMVFIKKIEEAGMAVKKEVID
jgi:hypothetical protein